jgi:hypothetical protein
LLEIRQVLIQNAAAIATLGHFRESAGIEITLDGPVTQA